MEAVRVADRMLAELLVTGQWKRSSGGSVREGDQDYRWMVESQAWEKDTLKLVTLQVTYAVRNQDYDIRVSTLLDPDQDQQ